MTNAAGTDSQRATHGHDYRWILVSTFFSFLPILSVVGAICYGIGMLGIAMPLAENQYGLAIVSFAVLAVVLARTLGPLAYRFAVRAFPLKASGGRHRGALRILRSALLVLIAACTVLFVWAWELLSSLRAPSDNIIEGILSAVGSYIALTLCAIVLLIALCVTYGVMRAVQHHGQPAAWAPHGFILFLRTFGSVSDSAALGPLMRGSGVELPVALLSSPREQRSSWNPMTLSVAGFSFRYPFRSTPVYLESTDRAWLDDVRRLASRAKLVVIDVSHRSPGLSEEVEILSEPALDAKTIRFEERLGSAASTRRPDAAPGNVLLVQRSSVMRWIALLLGFAFTYLGFLILTGVGVSLFDPNWSSTVGSVILWSSLVYALLPGIWGALALSPEAGFTRQSSRELKEAVRQRLSRREA